MREFDYDASTADGEDSRSNLVALGHLLARRRREMKLSVSELAKIVGATPADINALETGEWDVDVVLLMEIAQALRSKLSDDLEQPPFVRGHN